MFVQPVEINNPEYRSGLYRSLASKKHTMFGVWARDIVLVLVLIWILNRYFCNWYLKNVLMETVLIQINNKKAYKLLKKLEQQQLIQVLRKNTPSDGKLSEKYAGKLSPETADRLQEQVTKSRKELQSSTF